MEKVNRAQFIFLITALVSTFLSTIPLYQFHMKLHIILTPPNLSLLRGGEAGGAVIFMHLHKELVLQAAVKQQPQQIQTKINSKDLALSWGDIWNTLRRRKVPGGSKGEFCLITPRQLVDPTSAKQGSQEIWSLTPLFIWYLKNGTEQRVELFQNGSNEVFWSKKIKNGETKVIYDGKPLQPGQSYSWQVSANAPFLRKSLRISFQVMEAQKRDKITNELTQLEAQLKKQGASGEKIALAKANYFGQHELWSDALREIYTVPNPSKELTRIIKQIPSADYCKPGAVVSDALSR
ncbi:MAG: hypothetical protein ACR9NN_22650 [Nostochopsis sp.]